MWMILETLTMLGWRPLQSTSMMTQVLKYLSNPVCYSCYYSSSNLLLRHSLSVGNKQPFCWTMRYLCCYCRQQCEWTAAASWRWRGTSQMGRCWLVFRPLCESFPFPGAGCQREESPLVTKDERLCSDSVMKQILRALLLSRCWVCLYI